jgi:hypothetical protein
VDLREVAMDAEDQDRGREFELLDPVTGEATGLKFRVAGPDSRTQRRAQLAMVDELAELAGPDGRVSAENRERARLHCLARCVLGWTIVEDGEALPFRAVSELPESRGIPNRRRL